MRLAPPAGELTRDHAPLIARELERLFAEPGPVSLDLTAVQRTDSGGAALLAAFKRRAEQEGRPFAVTGVQPAVAQVLDLFAYVEESAEEHPPHGLRERVGQQGAAALSVAFDYVLLCADVAWFAVTGLFKKRGIRWERVAYEMAAMGSQALGVVGLIAFLVGGVISLQSAAQLRSFGANIFVVDLIGVSVTRELGPLMAAIVVAGRSGSAVAAELATMTITEEVDAIRTMGLNPTRYLVLPKVVAITITQPVLTVLADVLGILGGFLVAVTYLDVGIEPFLNRLEQALQAKDLITGLVKSVIFAQLIVTIGALCGLRTRGGADEVGRSTTTSVVASIFAVIVADALCSMLFYFGG